MRRAWWLWAVLALGVPPASRDAVAKPVACPRPELLTLTPGDAWLDGGQVLRGTDGRFTDDAGFAFDVEAVSVEPVDVAVNLQSCARIAASVSVSAIDPFSGANITLTLEATR